MQSAETATCIPLARAQAESRALHCTQPCKRFSMANKITMKLILQLKLGVTESQDNKSTQLQRA